MGETTQVYVGVKLIRAKPEARGNEPGYRVVYPDGYISWSPKEAFEKAYFRLSDPTSIRRQDVERFAGDPVLRRVDEKTTLVSVETQTGFVQHEACSCVDPEKYDEEIGRDVGYRRIVNQLWPCLGFVLQWARYGLGHGRGCSAD